MDIIYRKADIWDIIAISAMWTEMMQETKIYDINKEDVECFTYAMVDRLKMKDDVLTIIAEDNKKAVGFTHGYIQSRLYGQPAIFAFSELTYIKKKYRKHGIAEKLYAMFEKWAETLKLPIEFAINNNAQEKYWVNRGYIKYASLYRGGGKI
ncbi:MAG: GNAT family N-acetyltransferase [Candidatus Scalinduaceae bacterium]